MEGLVRVLWNLENGPAFASTVAASAFALLALCVISFILIAVSRRKWLAANRRLFMALLAVFLFALAIRSLMPLNFPSNAADFFYMTAGKNMLAEGKFQECDYALHCLPPKKPYLTYPAVASIGFLAFGMSVETGAWVNLILSSLSVIPMFFITKWLFKKTGAALLSSVLLSLLVQHIYYSNTIGPHPSAVFFTLLAVAGFLMLSKSRDLKTHVFALSALGLCIGSRLDHWIFLPFFALWYFLMRKDLRGADWKAVAMPLAAFGLLMLPNAMMAFAFAFNQGSDATDFGLQYSAGSAGIMLNSWLLPDYYEMWAIYAAGAVGAVILVRRKWWLHASLLLPGLVHLVMFIFYEYANTVNLRYLLTGSVLLLPIVSQLPEAAYGRLKLPRLWVSAVMVLLAVMAAGFSFTWGHEFQPVKLPLYEFTLENRPLLNRCVIMQCEDRISEFLLDAKVMSLSWEPEAAKDAGRLRELAGGRCVYFIETEKCDWHAPGLQESVKATYRTKLVMSGDKWGERISLYEVAYEEKEQS